MTTLLIILHVVVSLFLIGIVLLQHGKGADMGATFGGSNQSLFGTEGPLPLLNKITTLAAIIFMATSATLAYISANRSTGSVMSKMPAVQEQQVPVEQKTAAPVESAVPAAAPVAEQKAEAAAAPTATPAAPAVEKTEAAPAQPAPEKQAKQ